MSRPKIYVAADPLAAELHAALVAHLRQQHGQQAFDVEDMGVSAKYYEAAHKVGGLVQASRASGGADRAVLLCGTGMGMSIIANKFPAVFAAVVESPEAAANAAAINRANVLCCGAKVFKPEEAAAAVDKWLATPFTEGYPEFKEFLETSMDEIPAMLNGGGGTPCPKASIVADGQAPAGWVPIAEMRSNACLWCKLREDAAAGGNAPGTRLRALARFPAGSAEPPHHHTHGHDVLVLSGSKTVVNATTGETHHLGPLGYLYTPGGHVHGVQYHEDTVFLIAFDGPMDLTWEDPGEPGVQWQSEAARRAAAAPWRPPPAVLAAAASAAAAP